MKFSASHKVFTVQRDIDPKLIPTYSELWKLPAGGVADLGWRKNGHERCVGFCLILFVAFSVAVIMSSPKCNELGRTHIQEYISSTKADIFYPHPPPCNPSPPGPVSGQTVLLQ